MHKIRPNQHTLIDAVIESLNTHQSVLAVAPTGAGKTICLSKIIERLDLPRTLILAHRDVLTEQNSAKFLDWTEYDALDVGFLNSQSKNIKQKITFGMIKTVYNYRKKLITDDAVDLIVIDEAHHSAAKTYRVVIETFQKLNPKVKIVGLTATPQRADEAKLEVFEHLAHQISYGELITSGFLVKPIAKQLVTAATKTLKQQTKIKHSQTFYDQIYSEELKPCLDECVKQWQEHAATRKTIIFAPSIEIAEKLTPLFTAKNITCTVIHSKMKPVERESILQNFTTQKTQILINVAILTEGFDDPSVDCIVLMRHASHHSVVLQMIGRGMRLAEGKTDCLILDFGVSVSKMGGLDHAFDLNDGKKLSDKVAVKKIKELKNTKAIWDGREAVQNLKMIDFNLLISNRFFRWDQQGKWFYAANFVANCLVFVSSIEQHTGIALYKGPNDKFTISVIAQDENLEAVITTCDLFMQRKSRKPAEKAGATWQTQPITGPQLNLLNIKQIPSSMIQGHDCYSIRGIILWTFYRKKILQCLRKTPNTVEKKK